MTDSETCKKDRRGQIETFGLAFIVILISIGFFIFVSIRSHQSNENPQKEFTNDKLSNDFILSILDVSVQGCSAYTVKDLIIDCNRDHRIKCNTEESCIAVNRSITTLLNTTFKSIYKTKFRFYSENLYNPYVAGTQELINISNMNCTASSRQGQRGTAIISLYPAPGNVYLNMNICS